jgi:hypothetical protein
MSEGSRSRTAAASSGREPASSTNDRVPSPVQSSVGRRAGKRLADVELVVDMAGQCQALQEGVRRRAVVVLADRDGESPVADDRAVEVELARTERRMGHGVAGRGVDGHEFSSSVVADNDTPDGGPRERDCGRIDPLP